MERRQLTLKTREHKGGTTGRRLRHNAQIPGIVYGLAKPNLMVTVDQHEFSHLQREIAGENIIIDLLLPSEQEPTPVLMREIQRDPLTDSVVHIDFFRLSMETKMQFEIPVHGTGSAIGVKKGGVLDHITRSVEVICLPKDLLPHIEVDVSGLDMNQSFHLRDIELPETIEALSPPETTLFAVRTPRVEEAPVTEAEGEEEVEAPEEEGAEPELVSKQKGKEKEESEKEKE